MANEKPVRKEYQGRDVVIALLIVGTMIAAIIYFGKIPQVSTGKFFNKPAPNIEFEMPNGGTTSLARQKGKVILINFWASWCQPCMEEMPSLRMLDNHFRDKGFALFAFNIEETKESVRGVIPASDVPVNLIFNFSKEYLKPYDIRSIPVSILIDRFGLIRDVFAGPRNWMDINTINEIEELLR